jgi:hypothetical protein
MMPRDLLLAPPLKIPKAPAVIIIGDSWTSNGKSQPCIRERKEKILRIIDRQGRLSAYF